MNEFILNHPLITHKLAILRDINTGTKEFRELVTEISTILMYEAMRDAKLEKTIIETPLEKMETIVQEIDQIGEPIYLFGAGQKEKTILDQWAKKYKNAYSLVGQHTLPEEIEIMRHLRCMITMDSANMHLASIAGTRVLSIWGATHPNAGFTGWGQNSEDCIQREDLPCRPCSIYGNKKCKFGDYRCLSISPQTIIERVYAITQS